MRSRRLRLLIALAAGVVAAFGELALDCRRPDSEGCVWGRVYLPLSLGVGLLVVAPAAYALLTLVAALRGRYAMPHRRRRTGELTGEATARLRRVAGHMPEDAFAALVARVVEITTKYEGLASPTLAERSDSDAAGPPMRADAAMRPRGR